MTIRKNNFNTTPRRRTAQRGGPQVVHHGHSPVDEKRPRLRRFVKQVADGVATVIRDEPAPLVLAAVDYLHPIFGEAFREAYLLDEGIEGNPENMSEGALREEAWEHVAPTILKPRRDAQARYESLAHGEQAADNVYDIVPAAFQGRVDTLFVAAFDHVWGAYDPETNEVAVDESQEQESAAQRREDLLDFAAVQTLANGGMVYTLDREDVPGESGIAAIFRF